MGRSMGRVMNEKALPDAGAVDDGGFVDIVGDGLQTGKQAAVWRVECGSRNRR